jgi:hypothetical protein
VTKSPEIRPEEKLRVLKKILSRVFGPNREEVEGIQYTSTK